jgi:hypothetical protein
VVTYLFGSGAVGLKRVLNIALKINALAFWIIQTMGLLALLCSYYVMSQLLKHSVIKQKGRRLQWKKQEFVTFYSAQSRVPIKLI